MTTKRRVAKPTSESRALKAAIDGAKMTKAALAEALDVTPGLISQWVSGRTPVAPGKAPLAASVLGIDAATISAAYREIETIQGNVLPMKKPTASEEAREMGLVIARLENDVHALNMALGLLVGVMKIHRPAEASELASTIRRRAPARYRDKGLLSELLAALGEKPAR